MTTAILIPAHNASRFIATALASAEIQREDCRLVVVDDGSTDDTVETVRSFGSRFPRMIIRGAQEGVGAARNKALAAIEADAAVEFIAFLDADDAWPDGKLQRQCDYLRQNPQVDGVYGEVIFCHDINRESLSPPAGPILRQPGLLLGAGLFRPNLFRRFGLFDVEVSPACDTDFFLWLLEGEANLYFEPEIALYYRQHPDSLSSNRERARRAFLAAMQKSIRRRRASGKSVDLSAFFARQPKIAEQPS